MEKLLTYAKIDLKEYIWLNEWNGEEWMKTCIHPDPPQLSAEIRVLVLRCEVESLFACWIASSRRSSLSIEGLAHFAGEFRM
jgi:hypothetical protein